MLLNFYVSHRQSFYIFDFAHLTCINLPKCLGKFFGKVIMDLVNENKCRALSKTQRIINTKNTKHNQYNREMTCTYFSILQTWHNVYNTTTINVNVSSYRDVYHCQKLKNVALVFRVLLKTRKYLGLIMSIQNDLDHPNCKTFQPLYLK